MEYIVYIHPSIYEEVISKLSSTDQERINTLIQQFISNPYVGDSLQIKFIREKRFNGKRIHYVIFDDLKVVLIVAISDKKTQQRTINSIRSNMNEYRNYVKSIMDKS